MTKKKESIVKHELKPIYDEFSKILILGTMPSVKSRSVGFYYAHPKNRFWKVLEILFDTEIIEKETFLKENHIALWDVLKSCKINGSSDASIKEVVPNDIEKIIKNSSIKAIFTTGKIAHKYYQKFFKDKINIPEFNLPSTSPANCAIKMDELVKEYKKIKEYLI